MAKSSAPTVGTTATKIYTAVSGVQLTIKPAAAMFIGGSNVTTANGYPVSAEYKTTLLPGETLYGVCASGTVAVNVVAHGD